MILRYCLRRNIYGLTLLEVLVSINVLAVALMSFASIFPAAFKLNKNSHRQTKAAKYAAAVAEELRAKKVYGTNNQLSLGKDESERLEKKKLYLNTFTDSGAGGGFEKKGKVYYYGKNRIDGTVENRFGSLSSMQNMDEGFSVDRINIRQLEMNKGVGFNNQFFEIYVTVKYTDNVNGRNVDREVTVVSGRTGNRA